MVSQNFEYGSGALYTREILADAVSDLIEYSSGRKVDTKHNDIVFPKLVSDAAVVLFCMDETITPRARMIRKALEDLAVKGHFDYE